MRDSTEPLYAAPRVVTGLADCFFYHTMDVPALGRVDGIWDLRGREHEYLGGADLRGKRVLEIGPANGFLTFHMEKQGAEVVSLDLDEHEDWDVVPFPGTETDAEVTKRRDSIRRLNNGYWLAHRACGSKAKVVYGHLYEVPGAIGPVDVATFCSVLLHVRDPFRALASASRLVRETVVVTERYVAKRWPVYVLGALGLPCAGFEPRARDQAPIDTWWSLTPRLVREQLAVLGFGDTRTTHHFQKCRGQRRLMFTIVARRTPAI